MLFLSMPDLALKSPRYFDEFLVNFKYRVKENLNFNHFVNNARFARVLLENMVIVTVCLTVGENFLDLD